MKLTTGKIIAFFVIGFLLFVAVCLLMAAWVQSDEGSMIIKSVAQAYGLGSQIPLRELAAHMFGA
jgi:hypothetical protein